MYSFCRARYPFFSFSNFSRAMIRCVLCRGIFILYPYERAAASKQRHDIVNSQSRDSKKGRKNKQNVLPSGVLWNRCQAIQSNRQCVARTSPGISHAVGKLHPRRTRMRRQHALALVSSRQAKSPPLQEVDVSQHWIPS